MSELIERLCESRRDFIAGNGFEPARLIITPEDFEELIRFSAKVGCAGNRFMGMAVEIGGHTHCRAPAISGLVIR